MNNNLKILLIEDNPGDARLVEEYLIEQGFLNRNIVNVETLDEAKNQLWSSSYDIILLDLGLPDSKKDETVDKLFQFVEDIPVIIISGNHDEIAAYDSVKSGVQEYLVKGDISSNALERSIKNAIVRSATERELKELNSFKDNLLSVLSHDLRSPFSASIGYIDLMLSELETMSTDELRANLSEIKNISVTVLHFIENLLSWSRLQSENLKVKKLPFCLEELKEKSLAVIEISASSKNISILTEKLDDTVVYADIDMVDTVLRNLLSNAIKYSMENTTIEIDVIENDMIQIVVIDHGVGISEDNIEDLFDIRKKDILRGTRGERGHGLGLMICKDYIEKQGGAITIESEQGKGTKVTFTLPKPDKTFDENAQD